MEFGVNIMTRGIGGNAEGILTLARRAEALGYGALTINDHIVVPNKIGSKYPYTPTGEWAGAVTGECMDILNVLAFLAAATSKAKLITSVMVVPHRQAVQAAKQLATIDQLSGGRLVVGCGAGWMAEEFAALNLPAFAERGKVTDEYIAAFKELWTKPAPSFNGKYVRFADVRFEPKPLQKPHPPIWIGGESEPAIDRAVRLGDAWYPVGMNPRRPLDTVSRFQGGVADLKAAAEKQGRDPASIGLAFAALWLISKEPIMSDAGRRLFTGPASAILEDVGAFRRLGVGHVVLNFAGASLAETLDRMAWFASDVMARARN